MLSLFAGAVSWDTAMWYQKLHLRDAADNDRLAHVLGDSLLLVSWHQALAFFYFQVSCEYNS